MCAKARTTNTLMRTACGLFSTFGGEKTALATLVTGVAVYADSIPQSCSLVAEADRMPRVESVFAVGGRLPSLTREEVFALEPLYLRGSSAEEKAKEPRG